jgi:hypothetical protein
MRSSEAVRRKALADLDGNIDEGCGTYGQRSYIDI